jgi:tRNA(adenine34) deaminase
MHRLTRLWRHSADRLDIHADGTPDECGMRAALRHATRALEAGQLPVGAIVSLHGDVIGSAHCADKLKRKLVHAELLALIEADGRQMSMQERQAMTLFTTLEPCLMCLGAAMSFCIGRVVFAISAPADGAATRLAGITFGDCTYPEYRMPTIIRGVLEEDSRSLFQRFAVQSKDLALVRFASGIVQSK